MSDELEVLKIVTQLHWSKDSRSEMQLKDVRNLIKTADGLDLNYIDKWVQKLGLKDLYKETMR
jgi:hypothetical protein